MREEATPCTAGSAFLARGHDRLCGRLFHFNAPENRGPIYLEGAACRSDYRHRFVKCRFTPRRNSEAPTTATELTIHDANSPWE